MLELSGMHAMIPWLLSVAHQSASDGYKFVYTLLPLPHHYGDATIEAIGKSNCTYADLKQGIYGLLEKCIASTNPQTVEKGLYGLCIYAY